MGSDFYFEIERDTDRWTDSQREVQGRVAQILSLVQGGVESGESSDLWSILPETRIKDFMRAGDNLKHNCLLHAIIAWSSFWTGLVHSFS